MSYKYWGCSKLKNVKIEDGETTLELGSNHNSYFGYGEGLFDDCPIKNLYLGRNLSYETDNGYLPFAKNKNIKEVTIGNSVTSIDSSAFWGVIQPISTNTKMKM